MNTFKVTEFETNNEGDTACKELFSNSAYTFKKKNKSIKTGKVVKKTKKNRNLQVIKQKIENIVRTNDERNKSKFSKSRLTQKNDTEKSNKQQNLRQIKNKNSYQHTEKTDKKNKGKRKKNPISKTNTNNSLSQQNKNTNLHVPLNSEANTRKLDYKQKKQEKVKEKLRQVMNSNPPPVKRQQAVKSLRARMMERLQAARFRYINEQIYSSDSKEAQKLFSGDPQSFHAYHEGYRQQVNKWPLNPVDIIIQSIQKMPQTHIIADFGCGEAKLAKSVEQKVHSFDLISVNEFVTACDMTRVPLQNNSVDVVVFCLSLMGTNLRDYFLEANRVLKEGGIMKIAEVESRFEDINQFIEGVRKFHFKNIWKDLSHNLFYFLDFRKECNIKNKKNLPTISLHPCLYKKR